MHPREELPILRVTKGAIGPTGRRVVQEYPLKLVVNGRELATLIASPHRLNFLVTGFLRLQGFVASLDDLQMLGICAERGVAEVRIRGEVPERLRPTLTSGCGTGIVFNPPKAPAPQSVAATFSAEAVFSLMRELARRAEQYASHGGIHSAAVGDGEELLLFAEDLGRHNTLDRIAGEALFRRVDLRGRLLVTSGRVSTEMVAKAAHLGIAAVASRTTPTDMAVRSAEAAGITLIGYVRGDSFEVYTHPERLAVVSAGANPRPAHPIPGVTGVILAGGESRRMGSDKSLLPLDGGRFIDHAYRCLAGLFDEVIIVTNSPDLYAGLPCRTVPDLYPLRGSLAGIHSGLSHARNDQVFVVACDMPFLSADVIRRLCERKAQGEVVIPRSERGPEPLHALYDKRCLPAIEAVLDAGERRIVRFFPQVRVHEVPAAALADCDPQGRSFRNINTPQEYFALREEGKGQDGPEREQTPCSGSERRSC